jgi:hypothetical protein
MAEYISYNDLKVISPSPSSDTPARVVDDNFRIISDKFNSLKIVHHGTAEIIGDEDHVTVFLPTEVCDLPVNLTVIIGGKGWVVEKVLENEIMIGFTVLGQNSTNFDYVVINTSDSDFCEYMTINPE